MQRGSDTAARRSITAEPLPQNTVFTVCFSLIFFTIRLDLSYGLFRRPCSYSSVKCWHDSADVCCCFFFSQVSTAGARGQAEHAGVGAQEIHGAGWCVLQCAHISTLYCWRLMNRPFDSGAVRREKPHLGTRSSCVRAELPRQKLRVSTLHPVLHTIGAFASPAAANMRLSSLS